jgi:Tfp pilus assembly major pilin PilA
MAQHTANPRGFTVVKSLIVLIIIALLATVGVWLYRHTPTSYQSVITRFNTAMGQGDTATVASLESPAFKKSLETETTNEKNTQGEHGVVVTNNFYAIAKSDGDLPYFNAPLLVANARTKTSTYRASNNTTGYAITFDPGICNGASTCSPLFTIAVVPNGTTWLVDNVTFATTATNPAK